MKDKMASGWVLLPQVPDVGLCHSYCRGQGETAVLISSTETFLPGRVWRAGTWKTPAAQKLTSSRALAAFLGDWHAQPMSTYGTGAERGINDSPAQPSSVLASLLLSCPSRFLPLALCWAYETAN